MGTFYLHTVLILMASGTTQHLTAYKTLVGPNLIKSSQQLSGETKTHKLVLLSDQEVDGLQLKSPSATDQLWDCR